MVGSYGDATGMEVSSAFVSASGHGSGSVFGLDSSSAIGTIDTGSWAFDPVATDLMGGGASNLDDTSLGNGFSWPRGR